MKWFMAIAAVLTVPALAFAGASFTLTGNVGTSTGVTTLTIDELNAAGGVMSVDLGISTSVGCAGFDVALGTDTDDVFQMTGRTVHLSYWSESKSDKSLFTTNKLLKASPIGDQNLGGTYSYPGGSWPGYYGTSPADAMTVDLKMVGTITSFPYAISIAGAGVTGLTILDNSSPVQDIYDSSVPLAQVVITPEPASMLLLIGALPFLRRRRSA